MQKYVFFFLRFRYHITFDILYILDLFNNTFYNFLSNYKYEFKFNKRQIYIYLNLV